MFTYKGNNKNLVAKYFLKYFKKPVIILEDMSRKRRPSWTESDMQMKYHKLVQLQLCSPEYS